MTTQKEPPKNPVEYLAEQVNLLNLILEEQRKQTGHLSSISTAAILFVILVVIGFLVGFCRAFYG